MKFFCLPQSLCSLIWHGSAPLPPYLTDPLLGPVAGAVVPLDTVVVPGVQDGKAGLHGDPGPLEEILSVVGLGHVVRDELGEVAGVGPGVLLPPGSCLVSRGDPGPGPGPEPAVDMLRLQMGSLEHENMRTSREHLENIMITSREYDENNDYFMINSHHSRGSCRACPRSRCCPRRTCSWCPPPWCSPPWSRRTPGPYTWSGRCFEHPASWSAITGVSSTSRIAQKMRSRIFKNPCWW